MTILLNAGNGGSPGTPVTGANSATAGEPWHNIVVSGTDVVGSGADGCSYTNDLASIGIPVATRLTLSGVTYTRWNDSQVGNRFVARRLFYIPATPTTVWSPLAIRNSSGLMAALWIGADMRPMLAHGLTQVAASKPATPIEVGTLYWVELAVTKETAAGAGNGVVEMRITNASNQVVHEYAFTSGTTGTANAAQYRFGASSATTAQTYDYLSVSAAGPLASGWIGPANPTVTINTPAQNVGAGASVSATASASSVLGIASTAWTVDYSSGSAPALSGAATATVGLTAPGAGNLIVLKVTVTDTMGGTASATCEVRVPAASPTTVLPDDGGKGHTVRTPWATFGSVANAAAALRDSSSATGVESPSVGGDPYLTRHRIAPLATLSGLSITISDLVKTDSGALNARVRLIEGDIVRETFTPTVGTSASTQTFTASSATIAAIVDPGNLWVELQADD